MTATANSRVSGYDYKDVRQRHAPWALDTADSGEQDFLVRCLEPTGARGPFVDTGTLAFGRRFYERSLRKLMTGERHSYLEALDNQTLPYIAFLTHRGFGKTTLGVVWCARQLALRFTHLMLYTSYDYKAAKRRTESIRAAFLNADMQTVFGTVEPQRNQKASAAFSEDAFTLVDPETREPFTMVSPRGAGQTVNGSIAFVDGAYRRVDLIFSDDGQDRRNIANDDVRERFEEWFQAELMQCVEVDEQPGADNLWHPTGKPDWRAPWRVVLVDTCKHRLAMIMKCVSDPQWHSRVYPLAREISKGHYVSCTALLTDAQVQAMYARMRTKPDFWAREYLCQPACSEDQLYTTAMFRYFSDTDLVAERRKLIKFIIVDPSRTGSIRANPTSIKAVAIDTEANRIYIRKNLVKNLDPEVYYRATFDMAKETGTSEIWIEETGLSGVIRNAYQQAAQLQGFGGALDFHWLNSRRHAGVDYGVGEDAIKRARAAAMLPYYRLGLVFHEEGLRGGPLETSLLEYPECSEWGATDTLGYIPEILEEKGIYLDGAETEEVVDEEEQDDYEQAGFFFRGRAWCN